MSASTIHATALLIGERALLIRGAARSGKSSLALALIRQAQQDPSTFVRLIADDRVYIDRLPDALAARAPAHLSGMIEERGKGILNLPYESCGVITAVLDLQEDASGLEARVEIEGMKLPRFFHTPRAPFKLENALEIMEKAHIYG